MLTPSVPGQSDGRVARVLDIAATASPSTVFLHAVNKSRDKQAQVKVSFAGLSIAETYTMHIIADTKPSPADNANQQNSVNEQSIQLTSRSKRLIKVSIPSASVVIIEIPLLKR
jgi:alpha-L-arabinofuranosidase